MKKAIFVNAQQMQRNYPDTFEAPTQDELDNLKAGDYVKVSAGDEKFWCFIKAFEGDDIIAEINNDLVRTDRHGLSCGDIILFQKRHVFSTNVPDARNNPNLKRQSLN